MLFFYSFIVFASAASVSDQVEKTVTTIHKDLKTITSEGEIQKQNKDVSQDLADNMREKIQEVFNKIERKNKEKEKVQNFLKKNMNKIKINDDDQTNIKKRINDRIQKHLSYVQNLPVLLKKCNCIGAYEKKLKNIFEHQKQLLKSKFIQKNNKLVNDEINKILRDMISYQKVIITHVFKENDKKKSIVSELGKLINKKLSLIKSKLHPHEYVKIKKKNIKSN